MAGPATRSNGSTSNGSSPSSSPSSPSPVGPRPPYFVNKWGYGRPRPPSPAADSFAWKIIPWNGIIALDLCVSALLTYALFGFPAHSAYSPYAYLTLFPALVLVLALPAFALVAIPLSYILSPPSSSSTLSTYFTLKDNDFGRRWRGQKVPILTLYEAYFAGDIDLAPSPSGGPADLLTALYERDGYARYVIEWQHVTFFFTKFIPELLSHSRSQDVEQVREHYDRGDDFYSAFLGESMIYTSAIFNDEEETLEQAQVNKLNLVAHKLHLQPGDVHLDLGCGWGTLIHHFASQYHTDSTGVTLGKNQTEWANSKCKKGGVQDRARALCMDYRDTPKSSAPSGKYDKITCLEMSEHVGVKYYGRFCSQVYDMLSDDGVFFLQIAGLRKPWQFEDFNWGLFMGKYIFPGADASCPLSWVLDKLESAGFEVHSEETIGVHYSATIKRWYDNWRVNERVITAKYGQRWFRLWLWFLAWSVISPEQGSASCYQIVCHKNTKHFDRKQWLAERKYWKV